jgi:hypothetical protein
VEQFLANRGYRGDAAAAGPLSTGADTRSAAPERPTAADPPLDFVCEDDVRTAIRAGRKLVVSERAIITPSARELGESQRVFTTVPWRG